MKTLFVVSGNNDIGSGHIKRCILLSNKLKKDNFFFIGIKKQKYFNVPNNLEYEIKKFNRKDILILLNYCKKLGITRIIIDHTNINFEIQKKLFKKYFLVVFDSQKKINFMTNVIINANPIIQEQNYINRIKNKKFSLLLGGDYSLIDVPKRVKRKKINNIFFCFGGGDDRGILFDLLKYLKKNNLNSTYRYNLVVGPFNKNFVKYQGYIKKNNLKNIKLMFNPQNIYEIMQQCSYAVISPGTLFYELSFYSIPMFLVYLNDKQKKLANSWKENKLVFGCNFYQKVKFEKIMKNINLIKKNNKMCSFRKYKYKNNSKKIIKTLNKLS